MKISSKVLAGLALLLLIIGTVVQFNKTTHSSNNDFRVYYKTSQRIEARDWDNIFTRKDGPFPYRYAPYTLMGVSWIAHFTEPSARKIWVLLQAAGFFAGFAYLYLTLMMLEPKRALLGVSASVLLSFRYFLDSLYSGQVAGLMFFAFCFGLYCHLNKRYLQNIFSGAFSSSLKILPGFLLIHGFIKAEDNKGRLKYLFGCIILFILLNVLFLGWIDWQGHTTINLWKSWMQIVLADSEYFDGSTAKNQAVRGVLLRLFGAGEFSEGIWKISFGLGFFALLGLWFFKKSTSLFQEAYSYCLGVMGFILLMPASLPYQIMNVAIPVAVVVGCPKMSWSKAYKIMIGLFIAFMTFPTSDLIGRNASEWIQAQSLPFIVMGLLVFIMAQDVWKESV